MGARTPYNPITRTLIQHMAITKRRTYTHTHSHPIEVCARCTFNRIPRTLFFHSFILTRLKGMSIMSTNNEIYISAWISINRIEPVLNRHLIIMPLQGNIWNMPDVWLHSFIQTPFYENSVHLRCYFFYIHIWSHFSDENLGWIASIYSA